MKKNRMAWIVVVALLLTAPASWAATISFSPAHQDVPWGSWFFVDLTISGLGDASAPSLGVFDLDVSYNENVLGFSNAFFGDAELGDPLDFSGNGADYHAATYQGGIRLYGLSYDTPDTLETLQADSFTLARLEFKSRHFYHYGTGYLGLSINALGDAYGNALSADTQNGIIHVVPVPSALLLLGTGLAGAWLGMGRKNRFKR